MISPERLRRFPHSAGAAYELLQDLAVHAESCDFEAGDIIFAEGNPATHLMFLEEGEVDIVFRLGDDREVVVDTLVAGDTLSWSALIEPHTISATALASKDGRLIRVEAETLRRVCDEQPAVGARVMAEVAKVLRSRLIAMRVQLAAAR